MENKDKTKKLNIYCERCFKEILEEFSRKDGMKKILTSKNYANALLCDIIDSVAQVKNNGRIFRKRKEYKIYP